MNAADLRAGVRALIRNIPVSVMADADLDTYGVMGVRRISEDRPREVTAVLAGGSDSFLRLSYSATPSPVGVSSWIDGFSAIRSILNPAPDTSTADHVQQVDPDGGYVTFTDANGIEWVRLASATSNNIAIRLTTGWAISSLDGAATTTLPSRWNNALTYITTSITCYALATRSAGTTDSEVPGDLINYRTKQREYRDMAREWEVEYMKSMGLITGVESGAAAGLGRAAYEQTLSIGLGRMTHRGGRL